MHALIASGRAVVYPVYQGTDERRGPLPPFVHTQCTETHAYSSYQRQIVQDLRRTVDYLEAPGRVLAQAAQDDALEFGWQAFGRRWPPSPGRGR